MSNLIFGIDLGTTNTALSYLSVVDGRATVNLLKNRDGDELTPSVVYFHPGSLESIVGTPALLKYVEDPDRTFRWVKRDMGTPLTWDLGTGDNIQIITPQTIAALILRFICTDAERNLELESPISQAVITVPAYFGDAQKRATLDAAEMAGLQASLLEEPTAAILDYVLNLSQEGRLRSVLKKNPTTIAVFDLGGGTFDLSICEVRVSGTDDLPAISVIAKDGDPRLGGFDFDLALAQLALEKSMSTTPSNRNLQALHNSFEEFCHESTISDRGLQDIIAELMQSAEQMKRMLSHHKSVSFRIPRFRDVNLTVPVSRKEFEDSIEEHIVTIRDVASRTITQANANTNGQIDSWSKVDKVILIGGSTRIPAIEALVQATFGSIPSRGGDVDMAVAKGASIKGALDSGHLVLGGLRMTTSHDYGILDDTGRMTSVIVPKGSPYPHEYNHSYMVPFSLDVNLPLRIGQRYLGNTEQVSLKKFHHPFLYTDDNLDISISIDTNGMLHFRVVEPNSGERLEESILKDIGMSQHDKKRGARLMAI